MRAGRVAGTPVVRRARILGLASLLGLLAGCAARTGPGPAARAANLAVIPVGDGPVLLAIAPDGASVYAAASRTLVVIDTTTNAVRKTVAIDPLPTGLALTSDGRRALATFLFAAKLTVVDTAAVAVAAPIELIGCRQRGGYGRIAVTPDGGRAFLANEDNEMVAVVDLKQHRAVGRQMDMRPVDIAMAPDGQHAYVCGCRSFCTTGTVHVLDTASRKLTSTFSVGP